MDENTAADLGILDSFQKFNEDNINRISIIDRDMIEQTNNSKDFIERENTVQSEIIIKKQYHQKTQTYHNIPTDTKNVCHIYQFPQKKKSRRLIDRQIGH